MSFFDRLRRTTRVNGNPSKELEDGRLIKERTYDSAGCRVYIGGQWQPVGHVTVSDQPPSRPGAKYDIWSDMKGERTWVCNGYGWDPID